MVGSVYIETTIPSYLTAWPARNTLIAGRQVATREWWETRRTEFHLVTSQLVLSEAANGDSEAAQQRIESMQGIRILSLTPEVTWIARKLSDLRLLPETAEADGFHIGYAAAHGIDYLLTWNFRHIANAVAYRSIRQLLMQHGFSVPHVCSPEALMGVSDG